MTIGKRTKGEVMNQVQTVYAGDPSIVFQALGHPSEHPRIAHIEDQISVGDFIVPINGTPGAIFVMRPMFGGGCIPETFLDGEVLGAKMLTFPGQGKRAFEIARRIFSNFVLEMHEGREMDGFVVPFLLIARQRQQDR